MVNLQDYIQYLVYQSTILQTHQTCFYLKIRIVYESWKSIRYWNLSYFAQRKKTQKSESFTWAENGTRTRDPNLGKVVLYQLSYFRICFSSEKRCKDTTFFLSCKFSDFFFANIFQNSRFLRILPLYKNVSSGIKTQFSYITFLRDAFGIRSGF